MADAPTLDDTLNQQFQSLQNQVQNTQQIAANPNLDRRTGASLTATMAVGAAANPQDELATLRKYYPDAQPFGADNYVFTHPDTGNPTLYKSTAAGMHPLAWAARNLQEIPALVGGGVGAAGGGVLGTAAGPVGTVGGAMAGAGAGTAAGLEGYRSLLSSLGLTADTRAPGQVAGDVAGEAASGAVGEGAGRAGMAALRGMAAPFIGSVIPAVRNAAQNLGADLSGIPGMLTGSRGLNQLMELLGSSPLAAGTLESGKEATRQSLSDVQQRIMGNIAGPGGTTAADTGQAMASLQQAFGTSVGQYNATRAALDARIDQLGQGVRVIPQNIEQTLNRIRSSVAGAPNTRPEVQDALNFGQNLLDQSRASGWTGGQPGLDFPSARMERTTLGSQITWSPGPQGAKRTPTGTQAMQDVYDALRQDMLDSAGRSNPQLQDALQVHDNYVTAMRGGQAQISPTVGPGQYLTVQELGDLVQKNPSQAFNAVTQGALKSGLNGGNGTELLRTRNSVDPQSWRDFASHYFQQMGTPNPGIAQSPDQLAGQPFSLNNFATNWNKLSDGAKRALFDGYLPADQRGQLDQLAVLANAAKKVGYDVNWSGSGKLINAFQWLAGPLSSIGRGAATSNPLAVAQGVGRLATAPIGVAALQNPAFTRWLTSTIPEIAVAPNRMSGALGRLAAMKFEPDMQSVVNQYLQAQGYQGQSQP